MLPEGAITSLQLSIFSTRFSLNVCFMLFYRIAAQIVPLQVFLLAF